MVHDWEGVIFSDEYSVEKSPTGSQTWVFCLPSEKWHRSCILPKKCRKETSLTLWSCFYGKTRGPLVAHLEKSVNANVYLWMLHRYLLPIVYKIYNTIRDPVLEQDNAPIHKAGHVMQLFENHNIDHLTHPLVFTRSQSHRACVGSVEATTPYWLPQYRQYPRSPPRSKGTLHSSITESLG